MFLYMYVTNNQKKLTKNRYKIDIKYLNIN